MPLAIPAAITAVGAIGSAVASSSAQKKAASQANAANQAAVASQLQISKNEEALARDNYANNVKNFDPYLTSGYGAQSVVNQLLGLKPLSADQFAKGEWFTPGTVDYSKPMATAPAGQTPTPAPAPSPSLFDDAQIEAMMHDGIKGNGKAALAQRAVSPSASSGIFGNMMQNMALQNAQQPSATGFSAAPAGSIQQHAQAAIAAGADPAQVAARMAALNAGAAK